MSKNSSHVRKESKHLTKEDHSLIDKLTNNPTRMLMTFCGSIILASVSTFGYKMAYGRWVWPDDFCSVLLFGIAAGLIVAMTVFQELKKYRTNELELNSTLKLERHRMEMKSKEKFIELSNNMIEILQYAEPEKIRTLAMVAQFLNNSADFKVEEKLEIFEQKLNRILESYNFVKENGE